MIYYGWAGWGPWHDFYGTIWFFAGMVFAFACIIFLPKANENEVKCKVAACGIFALVFLSSALLGGYYSWFESQKVALNTCSHLKVEFQ